MRLELDGFAKGAGAKEYFAGSLLSEQAEFGVNPGNLRMFSYLPENLAPSAPLVVLLHGCLQSARAYDHGAGWSSLAQRFGFALLAPEQSRVNNANGCFNWFVPEHTARGQGEAASIRQMIETMVHEHSLDPKRVFITGLSAGGAMTSALLATYPETFAGGAIIAGLPYGAASNLAEALAAMHRAPPRPAESWGGAVRNASPHKGPWPRLSLWHGDADSTVAFSNMEAIAAQWLDVQGLDRPPQEERKNGYLRRVWRNERQVPVMESYAIFGLGHGTPIHAGSADDCCGEAGPFMLEAGISSSYRIAEFFGLTQKPRAARKPVEKQTVAVAQAAVVLAEPQAMAEATIEIPAAAEELEIPASISEEPRTGRLRRIIEQALKAAGLIKDR